MLNRWTALVLLGLTVAGCGAQARLPLTRQPAAQGLQALKAREDDALARMTAACRAGMQQIFDGIDADADARLTRAEWDARCLSTDWWAYVDADGDGIVRIDDFARPEDDLAQAKEVLAVCDEEFTDGDKNGDGQITGPELDGDASYMRMFDTDADGRVVLREVQAWWELFMSGQTGTIIWPDCPPNPRAIRTGTVLQVAGAGVRFTRRIGRKPTGPTVDRRPAPRR